MSQYRNIAFLFPGQGAQYPGMAKDFYEQFASVRELFEEANDRLGRNIAKIILEGPEDQLTETKNSQVGIYLVSIALLRVLQSLFPNYKPTYCAGLSLGEYTALTAGGYLDFADGLMLVQKRGELMNEACERTKGGMAVILGLSAEQVEKMVKDINLPHELWTANFNCPGQVVISGTLNGLEKGIEAAKTLGAKRALPLQVHGAFHSGLMQHAEERLSDHIQAAPFKQGSAKIVMNVTGHTAAGLNEMKDNLIRQVTGSVRWEQGVRHMNDSAVDLYVEIGCGKALTGFLKKIGTQAAVFSVENVRDLETLNR